MRSRAGQPGGWVSFHGGHSTFGDGRGTVAEIARAAAQRGFVAFGFSEHFQCPPHREFSPDGRVSELAGRCDWIDKYVATVRAAQETYRDEMAILLGTELEYVRGAKEWTLERIAAWPFDYF